MDYKALREKRGLLRQKLDDMLTNAGKETRGLNKDEKAEFNKMEEELRALDETIELMKDSKKDTGPTVEIVSEEKRMAAPKSKPEEGHVLTEEECRSYNMANVLRFLADPTNPKNVEAVKFEREISERTNKHYGLESEGIRVPIEVLTRSMSATAGNGAEFISTDNRVDMFVEMLRSKSVFMPRATILPGLKGNVDIPRQTAGSNVAWLNEDESATESTPTTDQLSLEPKTVTAMAYATRKLMKQSDMVIEKFIQNDLMNAIATEIDRVTAYGDGDKKPTGIANVAGIEVVELGTNGGDINWDSVVALETAVASNNADAGSLAYITNPKVRGKLKTTVKEAGTSDYLMKGKELNGYPVDVSTQVSSKESKGTAVDVLSDMFFGDFSDVIVAFWGSIDFKADPFSKMDKGGIRFVAMQDVDVAIRRPEKFAIIRDIKTA